MTGQVFKILPQAIWHTAIAEGAVPLHGVDADDGFVHLSAAEQLHETLRVHFNGQDNLVVLAFDADDLGVGLRWEAARGGRSFPIITGFWIPDRCARNSMFQPMASFRIAAGTDKKDCVNGHLHHIATFAVPPAAGNRP